MSKNTRLRRPKLKYPFNHEARWVTVMSLTQSLSPTYLIGYCEDNMGGKRENIVYRTLRSLEEKWDKNVTKKPSNRKPSYLYTKQQSNRVARNELHALSRFTAEFIFHFCMQEFLYMEMNEPYLLLTFRDSIHSPPLLYLLKVKKWCPFKALKIAQLCKSSNCFSQRGNCTAPLEGKTFQFLFKIMEKALSKHHNLDKPGILPSSWHFLNCEQVACCAKCTVYWLLVPCTSHFCSILMPVFAFLCYFIDLLLFDLFKTLHALPFQAL